MFGAVFALFSAVYQTHHAAKAATVARRREEETRVLKLWIILGITIPLEYYFDVVVGLVPFLQILFALPQLLFFGFYLALAWPFSENPLTVFDLLQPHIKFTVLPQLHAKLVIAFCALQSFFLGNFISIIPSEELNKLVDRMTEVSSELQSHAADE